LFLLVLGIVIPSQSELVFVAGTKNIKNFGPSTREKIPLGYRKIREKGREFT
jgi:hypothetical protein